MATGNSNGVSTNNVSDDAAPLRQAIRRASTATGAGFDYLMTTAERESSMNPLLRSRDSSAAGLFQFVNSTWLSSVKEFGAAHGYAQEAAAIQKSGDNYSVADPQMRQHIMDLRYDPQANALMAGAFTQKNNTYLTETLGRAPTSGELYIAHFLGAQGAGKFISATQASPNASAAALFPEAASANHSIFFTQDGSQRSLGEVYAQLVSHHRSLPSEQSVDPSTAVASATSSSPIVQAAISQPMPLVPETGTAEPSTIYRNLFTPHRQGGVSPVVMALWARHDGAGPNPIPASPNLRPGFFPMSPKV